MDPQTDLLGNPTTEVERELVEVYRRLEALADHEEAPPCVTQNARKALACLWQSMNDLAHEVAP